MAPPADPRPIAVVGGGWAGLAAALRLAEAGRRVTVYESARQLGGRSRAVEWQGLTVDNGQHLMIGAYRETLALLRLVGTETLLERRPLELAVPGFRLHLPRLPAPLHLGVGLLAARGLTLADKLAAITLVQHLKGLDFRLAQDEPVSKLLARLDQPANLVGKLWEPICVAALNTPMDQASAQVFGNVLRDSLLRDRAASDALFQRAHLGRLLPDAAQSWLARRGNRVRLSTRVVALEPAGGRYRLILEGGGKDTADMVILATHPARLTALLDRLPGLASVTRQLSSLAWQPILTTWLRFERRLAFPYPMLGLAPAQGPWAFDRQDVAEGVVAIVVSAEGPHLERPAAALKDEFLALLARSLGPLPDLLSWKTIIEKRATFACVPNLDRPGNRTPLAGLFLAGDHTAGASPAEDYPATIEGAVRSGVQCARLVLDET